MRQLHRASGISSEHVRVVCGNSSERRIHDILQAWRKKTEIVGTVYAGQVELLHRW